MFDAGQHPYDAISTFEPGDQQVGEWSFEQRLRMNEAFVERVQRAIALGLECCSRPAGDHVLQPMDSKKKLCAHCGDEFVPRRRDTLYCSINCNQKAYLKRRRSQCNGVAGSRRINLISASSS
jgi:hypothetical protein